MKKADKRKRLLPGMTETTKIRWAAKGKTTYGELPSGLPDYSKPTGFDVEHWGFYFKHSDTNEVVWLAYHELEFLGRRDPKPTSQEDEIVALAYSWFKCLSYSDGTAYTGERANRSWFIRYAVEQGFSTDEAEAVIYDLPKWLEIHETCLLMADQAGITDLPDVRISRAIPSSHKMEEAKGVPFAQLILNRMSKHKETRFKDIDG